MALVTALGRLIFAMAVWGVMGCASAPEEPQGHPHRATMVNDIFAVEQGMPLREVKKDRPFFFKKCESTTVTRRPYFSKTEYECNSLSND